MDLAGRKMRFWWVNQNQTYVHEIQGGYLWSPKRNAHGGRNPFYESMREVSPGDCVFSFKDTRIAAIGIAQSYCFECPKPVDFGTAGQNWENIGWKIKVEFSELVKRIRPKDYMNLLQPLLPAKYGPLQANGNGIQSVYLTEISTSFAAVLIDLIGIEATERVDRRAEIAPLYDDIDFWENKLEYTVSNDAHLVETEKKAIISARRGQGLFKSRVFKIERGCRLTKVDNPAHLRASHCKPWRDADNAERLDGENGLLLTPSMDHLFDRGFIGFEDNGDLIIPDVTDRISLERMGVQTRKRCNVGSFTQGQKKFLAFHRESVLLKSAVSKRHASER